MSEQIAFHAEKLTAAVKGGTILDAGDIDESCTDQRAIIMHHVAHHIAPSSFGTPRIAITRFRL